MDEVLNAEPHRPDQAAGGHPHAEGHSEQEEAHQESSGQHPNRNEKCSGAWLLSLG